MTKELWFKRKHYGWGWYPSSWQGWIIIIIFLILAIGISIIPKQPTTNDYVIKMIIPLAILVAILISICYKKGETPRWQWGV